MVNPYKKHRVTTQEARKLAETPGAIIYWAPDGNIGDPVTGEGSYAIYSNSRTD